MQAKVEEDKLDGTPLAKAALVLDGGGVSGALYEIGC